MPRLPEPGLVALLELLANWNETTKKYWKRQSARGFDFEVCCLCGE